MWWHLGYHAAVWHQLDASSDVTSLSLLLDIPSFHSGTRVHAEHQDLIGDTDTLERRVPSSPNSRNELPWNAAKGDYK